MAWALASLTQRLPQPSRAAPVGAWNPGPPAGGAASLATPARVTSQTWPAGVATMALAPFTGGPAGESRPSWSSEAWSWSSW